MSSYFKDLGFELETFTRLIDCFRLRCDDDYTFGQHNHGIYGQDDPRPVFQDFLDRARSADMLPEWWNATEEKECRKMAMADGWADIKCAVEKSDIQDHYNNSMMPMVLRMGGGEDLWRGVWVGSEAYAAGLSMSVLNKDCSYQLAEPIEQAWRLVGYSWSLWRRHTKGQWTSLKDFLIFGRRFMADRVFVSSGEGVVVIDANAAVFG